MPDAGQPKKPRKKYVVCPPRYESACPARQARPTDAVPGSSAKIEILAQRYARRQSLHAPGDAVDTERLRLRLVRAGNNRRIPDRDGVAGEVIDERKISEKNSSDNLQKLPGAAVGDRIREARLRAGLSMRQASLLLGMAATTLGKVERRDVAPCLWVLHLVSQHLGIDIDHLCCLDANERGTVRCLCG